MSATQSPATQPAPTSRIGEVIEASSIDLIAQCYRLYGSPPLGTLVRTSQVDGGIYGVITGISTESLDPGRRPIARGEQADTEDEVYQAHPQLSYLLRTNLKVVIVGHSSSNGPSRYLPAQPPRIHAFVYSCPVEEVRSFTTSFDFLRLLLADASPSTDEATASLLIMASQTHHDPRAFCLEAGTELAQLLGSDPPRLNSLLKRLSP